MKKFTSILLCLFLLLSCLSFFTISVSAAGTMYLDYDDTLNGWVITSCDADISIANIPESYDGYPIVAIGDNAFANRTWLYSVSIPDSVVKIGNNAFYECTSLYSVTFGNGVKTIGDSAFFNCDGLYTVDITAPVEKIGNSAFAGCDNINSLSLPNTLVEIGDAAFYSCDMIPYFIMPDSVRSLGAEAFYSCDGLKFVFLSQYITQIKNNTFDKCSGLTSVYIPDSVTSIGNGAFANSPALKEIYIPLSVTSMGTGVFDLSPLVTVRCVAGTYAESWASANGVNCSYLSTICNEHVFGQEFTLEEPSCSSEGTKVHYCTICGEELMIGIAMLDHEYYDAEVLVDKSDYSSGYERAHCYKCDQTAEYPTNPNCVVYSINIYEDYNNPLYLVVDEIDRNSDCVMADGTHLLDYVETMYDKFLILTFETTPEDLSDFINSTIDLEIILPAAFSNSIDVYSIDDLSNISLIKEGSYNTPGVWQPSYDGFGKKVLVICDSSTKNFTEDNSQDVENSDGADASNPDYDYSWDYSWDYSYDYSYDYSSDYSYHYDIDATADVAAKSGSGIAGWLIGGGIVVTLLLFGGIIFGLIVFILIIVIIIKIAKGSKKKKAAKAAAAKQAENKTE